MHHQWYTTSIRTSKWHKPQVWCHLGNHIKQHMHLGLGSVSQRVQSWTSVQILPMFYSMKQHLLALIMNKSVPLLSSPQCLNVELSNSTHQCLVDTTPSWINVLVPGFQEPSAADYLSESISIHEINVLFDMNVWFDVTNGIPQWALICLSTPPEMLAGI